MLHRQEVSRKANNRQQYVLDLCFLQHARVGVDGTEDLPSVDSAMSTSVKLGHKMSARSLELIRGQSKRLLL